MSVQSGLSLDLLAEELLSIIDDAGDSIDNHLHVASNGGGLAIFDPPYIHLQQPPLVEAVYNWTPAVDTVVRLVSTADVLISSANRITCLRSPGHSTTIKAGTSVKISVTTATGQCALEICEPIR